MLKRWTWYVLIHNTQNNWCSKKITKYLQIKKDFAINPNLRGGLVVIFTISAHLTDTDLTDRQRWGGPQIEVFPLDPPRFLPSDSWSATWQRAAGLPLPHPTQAGAGQWGREWGQRRVSQSDSGTASGRRTSSAWRMASCGRGERWGRWCRGVLRLPQGLILYNTMYKI